MVITHQWICQKVQRSPSISTKRKTTHTPKAHQTNFGLLSLNNFVNTSVARENFGRTTKSYGAMFSSLDGVFDSAFVPAVALTPACMGLSLLGARGCTDESVLLWVLHCLSTWVYKVGKERMHSKGKKQCLWMFFIWLGNRLVLVFLWSFSEEESSGFRDRATNTLDMWTSLNEISERGILRPTENMSKTKHKLARMSR